MLGHPEVQHLATTMLQHDEHEENLQGDRGYGEEIDRNHLAEVIVEERLQGLVGPWRLPEDAGDSTLGISMPSATRHEFWGCAIAGWPQPSVQSNAVSRRESWVCRDDAASLLTVLPRICETGRVASRRRCRLRRTSAECASFSIGRESAAQNSRLEEVRTGRWRFRRKGFELEAESGSSQAEPHDR